MTIYSCYSSGYIKTLNSDIIQMAYDVEKYGEFFGKQPFNISNIHLFEDFEIQTILSMHADSIGKILSKINQGDTDVEGREVDTRKHIKNLHLLIQSTKKMQAIMHKILSSEKGQAKWNKEIDLLNGTSFNMVNLSTIFKKFINDIKSMRSQMRSHIDLENADNINPFLIFLPLELTKIIGQYMD